MEERSIQEGEEMIEEKKRKEEKIMEKSTN